MTKKDLTPATKKDLQALEARMDRKFQKMEERIKRSTRETKRHFDVTMETIRRDLFGANHDRLQQIKDAQQNHGERITVLEQAVGLVAH